MRKVVGGYCYSLRNGTIITTFEEHPYGEILDRLTAIATEEGFPLTEELIIKYGEAPTIGSIRKYVGDIEQVNKWVGKRLEKAGLLKGATKMGGKRRTEEQLLKEYYDLWAELGKMPSATDVEQAAADGKCASKSAYALRFGGLANTRDLVVEKYGNPLAPASVTSEREPAKIPVAAPPSSAVEITATTQNQPTESQPVPAEEVSTEMPTETPPLPLAEPAAEQEATLAPKATISIKISIPGLSEPISMEITVK